MLSGPYSQTIILRRSRRAGGTIMLGMAVALLVASLDSARLKGTAPGTWEEILTSISPEEGPRILIAEDVQINQIVAIRMVEKLGYKAQAVVSGSKVLDALHNICRAVGIHFIA